MKKKIFFYSLMLIFLVNVATGQTYQQETVYGRQAKRFLVDSTLRIPKGLSTRTNANIGDSAGLIALKDTTDGVYYFTGQRWKQLGGGGGSGTLTGSDTVNISYRIDTLSTYLSGYVPTFRTLTAGLGLSGGGDLSANRTFDLDTASAVVLSRQRAVATYVPLIRTITTGWGLSGGGDFSIDRTHIADSGLLASRTRVYNSFDSFALTITNNYQPIISGTGYGKWSGSSVSFRSNTQLTSDVNTFTQTLSGAVPAPVTLNGYFLKDDGTWAAAGTGTVTSLSQGYGIINSTNPITTTGTQRIDTFAISTRAWRDKLADSLGALIGTKGTGTVTSVGLTMPSAFSVSGSPISTSGTIAITGSGTTSQYIRGDGTLATYSAGLTNPMTTRGDLITGAASGTPQRLGLGPAGSVVTSDGTDVIWSTFVPYVRYISASKSAVAADGGKNGSGSDGGTNASAYNFLIGFNSGYKITTGINNVGLGQNTLDSITDAEGNIAIGGNTLAKMTTPASGVNSGHMAIGYEAMFNTLNPTIANTAIGRRALYTNTTGGGNTGIGLRVLETNSTGSFNTAIGTAAANAATGSNNVDIGYQAGTLRTSGGSNIAIGYLAMSSVTAAGADNTFVGAQVATGSSSSTGAQNTAIGKSAFTGYTTGAGNVAIGYLAGASITSGAGNVWIHGSGLGETAPTSGSYNLGIGIQPRVEDQTKNFQLSIGNFIFKGGSTANQNKYIVNASGTYSNAFTITYANGAALDVQSTTGGIKFPSLTTTQRDAISTPATGVTLTNTTTNTLDFYNGTGWLALQPQQSRVSTQFDKTSNTTLANVTGLTADLVAGKFYRFEAILYTTSNSGGGVQFAVAGTATATAIIYEGLTTDAGLTTQGRGTALGTAVGAVTAVTAGYTRISGTIQCNAAGTLTIQFAQNASNGTASSVLVGSTFVVTQML